MSKREKIQKRIRDAQNDYHSIMMTKVMQQITKIDKEKANQLQKDIIIYTTIEREMALDKAKQALEKAFTPRIKAMLSKKIQDKINEDG